MGTRNKGRSAGDNEFERLANVSRTGADAAIDTASRPGEIETRRSDQALALDRWRTGEAGPIDVRNMPGGGANMALFEDSMKVNDAGRIGRGVGTMAGNANPNFTAALNSENEMERHKFASGALEENVNETLARNDEEMGRLTDITNQRNQFTAGTKESRYENDQDRFIRYLMRPKQPNFFKTLAAQWLSPKGVTSAVGLAG